MESLTAWSTLVIAIFTVALVIVAGVNLQKFVENVRLVAESVSAQNKSLTAQTRAIDLQNESLIAQTRSIDLQSEGIKEQNISLKLQAEGLTAQTKALELQNKDLILNYKPTVYIKGVSQDSPTKDLSKPICFVLTNSGKLPAREVSIIANVDIINGTNRISYAKTRALNRTSVYPNSDLLFWIPIHYHTDNTDFKAQFKFLITYKGETNEEEMKEHMTFINTPDTNHHWANVEPNYNLLKYEISVKTIDGDQLSKRRLTIIVNIIENILGVDFVIKANSDELAKAFAKTTDDIAKLDGKNLTGFNSEEYNKHVQAYSNESANKAISFRTDRINNSDIGPLHAASVIDNSNNLTQYGILILKKVAEHLKSLEQE